jgi:hypothetical protein
VEQAQYLKSQIEFIKSMHMKPSTIAANIDPAIAVYIDNRNLQFIDNWIAAHYNRK